MFLSCFIKGIYTFLSKKKKSIKWDMVCYAKDMLGALQNLHVQDSGTKICDYTHIKFLKILQVVVYGLQSSKTGGDKGDGIVWVVQQEPDELVILFQK